MQLARATYSEALTMLRFGLAVRRAAWPEYDFIRRYKVAQPAPETLPADGWAITRWTPTQADTEATDWEEA